MSKVSLFIPEFDFPKDFTIFYKGIDELKEIKTSKESLLRKLRFFKSQNHEIQHQNEIFIHENYSCKLFEDFIASIETKEIIINTENYSDLYELSSKYQYFELKQKIEQYIKERPDLNQMTSQLSEDSEDRESLKEIPNFSKVREEIISENLDYCLQNSLLSKIPIQTLIRIINSPKRKLKDHHLLFNFITEKIKMMKKESNKNQEEDESEQKQYIELLKSSLDLNEMNEIELNELFNNDLYSTHLISKFDKEKYSIKDKINNIERFVERKIRESYQKIEDQSRIINEFISKLKKEKAKEQKEKEEMIEKILNQQNTISSLQDQIKKETEARKSDIYKLQNEVLNVKQTIRDKNSKQQNDISIWQQELKRMKDDTSKLYNQINQENLKAHNSIQKHIEIETKNRQNDLLVLNRQVNELNSKMCNDISKVQQINEQIVGNINNDILKVHQQNKKENAKLQKSISSIQQEISNMKNNVFEMLMKIQEENKKMRNNTLIIQQQEKINNATKIQYDDIEYKEEDIPFNNELVNPKNEPDSSNSNKVFVHNIPFSATAKDIHDSLTKFGKISFIRIIIRGFRGNLVSSGKGIVYFKFKDSLQKAINAHFVELTIPGEKNKRRLIIEQVAQTKKHDTACIVGIPAFTQKRDLINAFKIVKPIQVEIEKENNDVLMGFAYAKFSSENDLNTAIQNNITINLGQSISRVLINKNNLDDIKNRKTHSQKFCRLNAHRYFSKRAPRQNQTLIQNKH